MVLGKSSLERLVLTKIRLPKHQPKFDHETPLLCVLTNFCERYDLNTKDRSEIIKIGKIMLQELGGLSEMSRYRSMLVRDCSSDDESHTCPVWQYPPVLPDWNEIDAVHRSNREDDTARLLRGPKWSGNSCAFDVIIALGFMINAYRIKVDQQIPIVERPKYQQQFQVMMLVSWDLFSVEGHEDLRTKIISSMADVYSDIRRPGGYSGVSDILCRLFAGLPQSTASVARIRFCCSGIVLLMKYPVLFTIFVSKPIYKDGIRTTFENVEDLVHQWFQPSGRIVNASPACPDCAGTTHKRRNVIIDRMCPTLILQFASHPSQDWITEEVARERDMTKAQITLNVPHLEDRGSQMIIVDLTLHYTLVGAIFFEKSHYTLKWMRENGELWHYDGMRNEGRWQKLKGKNWWHALGSGASLCHLIYRLT